MAIFALLAPPDSPTGVGDPAFDKVPFDQWLSDEGQAPFHWSAAVPKAELSFHQRLMCRVAIRLDGRDLQNRRGDGQLVFLIQITDQAGARYRNHGVIDLGKLDENVKAANIEYSQRAFCLPGEYDLAVMILDSATREHSTRKIHFRVPAVPHDFLAAAWRGLPPIEFVGTEDAPDGWFLPEVQGRLQWAAGVHNPARLTTILNVTPHRTHSSDMAALMPTLKALTQTGSTAIAERVELFDLSRRRAAFDESNVRNLDWPLLKEALGESNTASIDLHSLTERHEQAQYFVGQVRKILRAAEQPCALVVLTPPVVFPSGEDLNPISTEALPLCRVIYIRYRAPVAFDHTYHHPQFGGRGRPSRESGPTSRTRPLDEVDQLEPTLKPLNPKVFDVEEPDQITKAFSEIAKGLL